MDATRGLNRGDVMQFMRDVAITGGRSESEVLRLLKEASKNSPIKKHRQLAEEALILYASGS